MAWSWRSSTRSLPLAAVQFHPESILGLDDDVGLRLQCNVVAALVPRVTPVTLWTSPA